MENLDPATAEEKNKNVPICRSVFWPAAQVTGEHALLHPITALLTCKLSFLRTRERILRVEEVTVGLHPGGAAAVCRRPLWRRVMMPVTRAERKEAVERAVDH